MAEIPQAEGEALAATAHGVGSAGAAEGLVSQLYGLAEGGATALAPAICVALGMAKKSVGSKIIVCTDGVARVSHVLRVKEVR